MMQEYERQQYLKVMGIQSWMPRFPLPFAPSSPQVPWIEHPQATKAQDAALTDAPSTSEERVSAPAQSAQLPRQEAVHQPPEPITPDAPASVPERWCFLYLKSGAHIFCFETNEDPSELKLAQSIINAILPGQGQTLTTFRWPLVEAQKSDFSAGQSMLTVFMRELTSAAQHLLVFGDLNKKVFLPILGEQWMPQPFFMQQLPSLNAMLNDVEQKRTAWNVLKPLFCQ